MDIQGGTVMLLLMGQRMPLYIRVCNCLFYLVLFRRCPVYRTLEYSEGTGGYGPKETGGSIA